MNYNTQRLTQLVNNNINQRRRAVGKGTRETQYRNLCKTQNSEVSAALRSISRHRVGHTYGEVWNLNASKKAHGKNRAGLQQLATILASKTTGVPAITVVADFIAFVMMHHNIPVDDVVEEVEKVECGGSAEALVEETPEASVEEPISIAANDGDDDWESFADNYS